MDDNKSKYIALTVTVLVHVAAVIVLLLCAFTTPLPLPGEAGVEVDLGMYNEGMGIKQDPKPTVTQPKPVVQPQHVEEKTVTQDMEETPAIEKPTPEKTAEKPIEEQEEQEKPVEKPTPEVNQRALFKAPTSDQPSSSEGITGNEGDQGTPEGLENIQKYEGQGGSGGGPSFSLGNRGAKHLPTPHIDFREEGVVVVDIIVDKKGIVKNVSIGKGTTTTNATLRETALKAALNAVFTEDPNAPDEQKGTITYTFIIRQ